MRLSGNRDNMPEKFFGMSLGMALGEVTGGSILV